MKRRVPFAGFVALLVVIASQAVAVDYGGSADSSTRFTRSEDFSLYQKNKLSLWFDTGQEKNIYFSAQGSYTYAVDRPIFFDLELIRLTGLFPGALGNSSLLTLRAGRFSFADFTGNILDHNADGLSVEIGYPNFIATVFAGYTGLLFGESSTVILSNADLSDSIDLNVLLAAPRIIESVELSFPELFWDQDLVLTVLAQQDLRQISGTESKVHTQYYGIGVSGPLSAAVYQDTFFYLSTGTTSTYSTLSYLFGAGIRYFNERALFSRTELSFILASGDEDYTSFLEGNTSGRGGTFLPISQRDFGLIFSPQLGNVFLAELSYSLKPLAHSKYPRIRDLQTMIAAYGFFRTTTGAISEAGIDSSSDSRYLGTEIDGILNFRPFSDLGFSLATGFFIPNNGSGGAFLKADREFDMVGRFDVSFSF